MTKATQMLTTADTAVDLANAPEYLASGVKALAAFKSGEKSDNKGMACSIYALSQAWDVAVFSAHATDGKGELTGDNWLNWDLNQYVNRAEEMPKSADGKEIRALQTAAFRAVMEKVFGLGKEELSPRIKTLIFRAMETTYNLLSKFSADDVTLNSKGNLCVPYAAVNKKPKADADVNAKSQYDALAGTIVELNRTHKENSLAALQQTVTPEKTKKGADKSAADKQAELAKQSAQGLANSLTFVCGVIQSWTEESKKDGTNIAPSVPLERSAHLLMLTLERYFAENPDAVAKFNASTEKSEAA